MALNLSSEIVLEGAGSKFQTDFFVCFWAYWFLFGLIWATQAPNLSQKKTLADDINSQ